MREINGNEMQELRQRINGARPLKPLARVRYRETGCETTGVWLTVQPRIALQAKKEKKLRKKILIFRKKSAEKSSKSQENKSNALLESPENSTLKTLLPSLKQP